VREIDFLPEWYRTRKRHQRHVRRQYMILTVAFLVMMGYNLTSMHRITRASGELARSERARVAAQNVIDEFNTVTAALNRVRVKADVIERVDSRIDVAAVLAEMSHIIGETVVLSRVEFVAAPFEEKDNVLPASAAGVRPADNKTDTGGDALQSHVRFRILLTGVAVSPADVAALVCRLDDSPYFQRVHTSFWRSGKLQLSAPAAPGAGKLAENATERPGGSLDVTEFEIVCDLGNYKEMDN